jgi:hypothetical protein
MDRIVNLGLLVAKNCVKDHIAQTWDRYNKSKHGTHHDV